MFTIWFYVGHKCLKMDVDNIAGARSLWDDLARHFDMASERP